MFFSNSKDFKYFLDLMMAIFFFLPLDGPTALAAPAQTDCGPAAT